MIDVDLDHVGLATPDLDRARAAYQRLGFRLTRRNSHVGPVGEAVGVEHHGAGVAFEPRPGERIDLHEGEAAHQADLVL